ncbi:MAG: hemerythrin family protein [Candidatus Paceibacterota bacterium]
MSIHFEWNTDLSVGEATIDTQHQQLLAQVNKLIDAMVYGAGSEEVASAVAFLGQYANEHLDYEEAYMERLGFKDLAHHKTIHDDFRKKYIDFKTQLEAGMTAESVLIEMEKFLGQWWLGHIGYEDRKYHEALGAPA